MKRIALLLILAARCAGLPVIESLPAAQAFSQYNQWNHRGEPYSVSSIGHTGSMLPYLVGGELALLERYEGQAVNIGDLIVFNRWDAPNVVHSVVDVVRGHFQTRGLNCVKADGWYPNARIQWIVRRVIRLKS